MRLALGALALCAQMLVCASQLQPVTNGGSGEAFFGPDASGNLVVNASTSAASSSKRNAVVLNGVDALATLAATQADLDAAASQLSSLRKRLASVNLNQQFLYVFGGRTSGDTVLDTVEKFDGASWSPGPRLTRPRYAYAAAVLNGRVYIAGGLGNASANMLSSVESFNGTTWVREANLTTARAFFGIAAYKGTLYAFGGGDDAFAMNPSYIEAFTGSTWSAMPLNLTTPRKFQGVAVYKDLVYIIGGKASNGALLDSVEIFDGRTLRPGPGLKLARYWFGCVVYNDLLYVVSGQSSTTQTSIEVFDGVSFRDGPPTRFARSYPGAAVFDGFIFLAGGHLGTVLNTTERFDTGSWVYSQSLSTSRYGFGMAVL